MGRRNGHRAVLEKLLGNNGEKGFEAILKIAQGQTTYKRAIRAPEQNENVVDAALIPVEEILPSIRERMDSWMFLIEHLVGKPQVNVEIDQTVHTELDYSQLSEPELLALRTLMAKAKVAAEQIVDGEIVEEQLALEEPKDPRVMTLLEAAETEPVLRGLLEPKIKTHDEIVDAAADLFRGKGVRVG